GFRLIMETQRVYPQQRQLLDYFVEVVFATALRQPQLRKARNHGAQSVRCYGRVYSRIGEPFALQALDRSFRTLGEMPLASHPLGVDVRIIAGSLLDDPHKARLGAVPFQVAAICVADAIFRGVPRARWIILVGWGGEPPLLRCRNFPKHLLLRVEV